MKIKHVDSGKVTAIQKFCACVILACVVIGVLAFLFLPSKPAAVSLSPKASAPSGTYTIPSQPASTASAVTPDAPAPSIATPVLVAPSHPGELGPAIRAPLPSAATNGAN